MSKNELGYANQNLNAVFAAKGSGGTDGRAGGTSSTVTRSGLLLLKVCGRRIATYQMALGCSQAEMSLHLFSTRSIDRPSVILCLLLQRPARAKLSVPAPVNLPSLKKVRYAS